MERIHTSYIDSVIASSLPQGKARTIVEVTSVSLESRDSPVDPYWYLIGQEKLLDPITGKPVEQSISVKTSLDQIEMDAFSQLQEWAVHSLGGFCLWLSPPHPDRKTPDGDYLRSKIIVSQVEVNQCTRERILENRAVVFGDDLIESVRIANELSLRLSGLPIRYLTSEDVRQYPVFTSIDSLSVLLPHLHSVIPEASVQWQLIESGEDLQIAYQTQIWAARYVNSFEMYGTGVSTEGYVGNRPLSCSVLKAPFETVFANSITVESKYVVRCGSCGVRIERYISKGYKCEYCEQIYEGC